MGHSVAEADDDSFSPMIRFRHADWDSFLT